jgi:hypothetical protein
VIYRRMSDMGQTEKNSVRANVFRFTLKLGHRLMQSACLKRANIGLSVVALVGKCLRPPTCILPHI